MMNPLQSLVNQPLQSLANQGHGFSLELYGWHHNPVYDYLKDGYDYLSIILAYDLIWAQYAANETEFLDYAVDWFDNNYSLDQSVAEDFSLRKGSDNLAVSMQGLKTLHNNILRIPDFTSCTAIELATFQNRTLTLISNLINQSNISGVKGWLYYGIFKLIVIVEKRLWTDPDIDDVILPSGVSVTNGLRRLKRDYPSLYQISDRDLRHDPYSDILNAAAFEANIHNECKKLARTVNDRALHINSGLYQYGRREININ